MRRTSRRTAMVLAMTLAAVVSLGVPAGAGPAGPSQAEIGQAEISQTCITDPSFPLRGGHEDVIARFDSGRYLCSYTSVEDNFEAGLVRARIDVYAVGFTGLVPAVFFLQDFQLRYAKCPPGQACSPGGNFRRCYPDACRIETTRSNPIAVFVGTWHDAGVPFLGNTAWRAYGAKLRGTILTTSDASSNHCVSSYVWRVSPHPAGDVISPPLC
jgi:hypothetical protein